MSHHDELPTLSDAALAAVTGGFMQFLQQAMGMAGGLINQFGDDKAKQAFGTASNIMGQVAPMISGMMGSGGGAGG